MYTNHNVRSRMNSLGAHLSRWHYLQSIKLMIVGVKWENTIARQLVSWA